MRDLEGKIALITGGGKGLGKVVARKLAERGAHVLINFFHSLEAAKKTRAELEATGAKVDLFRASVARKDQVDRMFDEIESKYGYLDILINNAASGAFVASDGVTEEFFSRALDTNLKGSFWCARRAAPLMAKRGGGTIVNLSSMGAGQVIANYVVVGTSKAAVESLTRYLAVEFGPLNIRVNTASGTLLEGEVATLFPRYEEMKQASIAATPLGRIGTEDELADLVMFLTSNQSRLITGQTILADGGLSLNSEGLAPPGERLAFAKRLRESLNLEIPVSPAVTKVIPPASSWQPAATVETTPPEKVIEPVAEVTEIEDSDDIAIVGMGLAFPGANNPEEYWKTLIEGPELFALAPPDRWDYQTFYSKDMSAEDKTYQGKSVFITGFEASPELKAQLQGVQDDYEMTTLWLRHSLVQALKGVNRQPQDRYSFNVGYTADGSQHLEETQVLHGMLQRLEEILAKENLTEAEKKQLLSDIEKSLKERYWRGVQHPARFLPHSVGLNSMQGILPEQTELVMVDTACSSSMYGVDLGIKGLLMGKYDIAVCGGAFGLAPRPGVLFAKLHGLSVSGEVRPLDKNSDGVLFSDGAGVVVLKKLKRALVDGDRILGVIGAFGSSSDGKGKAIYAPSSDGQAIAIRRVLENTEVTAVDIDWVVAHATGTPAGDSAEYKTLRDMYGNTGHEVYLTSNKSLIGHTGWAAGVASIINVLLGLQHNTITPQHRFDTTPAHFEIESSGLRIPKTPVSWLPVKGRPRAAAISGFGFGGTNAHMVIKEYLPGTKTNPAKPLAYGERVAIVGWAAHLPGFTNRQELEDWLKGRGKEPKPSFGEFYPLPSFEKVRMPPSTIRTLDRCQLMILDCAQKLRSQLGDFWDKYLKSTGVIMGHMGQTRAAALYGLRSYLDDVKINLKKNSRLQNSAVLDKALENLTGEVRRLVPPSNEDSFPGSMPNVIPARVANYFNLNGLNMTVDTGFSSAFTAFEMAARYLRSQELEMALVGGINGNSMPEMREILRDLGATNETVLAEGAFLFALVTETTARNHNLPVLGYLGELAYEANPPQREVLECGHNRLKPGNYNYLGAEGALEILRAIVNPRPETVVVCREQEGGLATTFRLYSASPEPGQGLPEQFLSTGEYAPGKELQIKRYVPVLQAFPLEQVRSETPFLPNGTLLLTNKPELVKRLENLPPDLVLISTEPFEAPMNGKAVKERYYLPEVSLETLEKVLAPHRNKLKHLRVLSDLSLSAPLDTSLSSEPASLVALHDLVFLSLKLCYDNLLAGQSSFISLFLGALTGDVPHPFCGLFGGTVKSAMLELPGCLTYALFTGSNDPQQGAEQARLESTAKHFIPVIYYQGSQRKTYFLDQLHGEVSRENATVLGPDSVVVATAGARGITAELVKALARYFRPHLYLIGSNRLDRYPPETFEGSDEDFARKRPEFLRREKAAHPELSIGALNKIYDRMADARATLRNLAEMEQYCGKERVRYIACDVLDRDSVTKVVDEINGRHGRVDLLINAAGLSRSSSIPLKSLSDFQAVRNIKLKGYQNLKYAFRHTSPRIWCNFNSFIGLTGQLGETDYSAGNDFLSSAANYSRKEQNRDEFSIGWGLWANVGLGATPMTKEYLEKQRLYTGMETDEGIHHFMRELMMERREAVVTHLGVSERKLITDMRPDFFTARETWNKPARNFYLGREVSRTGQEVVFERVFDLDKDYYLAHHVVNGYATLPGTFVPEIAAEAASSLIPGMRVVALEDAVFHHFLRVYDRSKPGLKKITARVLERDEQRAVVQVKVMTDIVSPKGIVLTKDKLHFEIKVIMSREAQPAPDWRTWSEAGEVPVPDPYHFPNAPVLLTEMFVSTRDTRLNPVGKRATYSLRVPQDDPVFSSFIIPSILLDGLARVQVLNMVEENYIPLVAPASIRRIDVYEALNDCELSQKYGSLALYATPRELDFSGEKGGNRCVAVRPDGKIVLQLKDMTGVVMGYVHRTTGEFITREKIEEMQQRKREATLFTGR